MKTLQHAIGSRDLRLYWIKKGKYPADLENWIDWRLLSKSTKGLKGYRQRWLTKWITGVCGVGKMLKIYKYQDHSRCPRCNVEGEDTAHVLQCPEPIWKVTWNREVNNLRTWMIKEDGCPTMTTMIIMSIQAWQSHSPYPAPIPSQYISVQSEDSIHQFVADEFDFFFK